ncbi:hypothetical protein DFJ74DRAFT_775155 [Hyaloraphidium curvatum]|nr:hypothetical protein DFJ74DRAFT_775155 [Hyaloraphidium curvatum]
MAPPALPRAALLALALLALCARTSAAPSRTAGFLVKSLEWTTPGCPAPSTAAGFTSRIEFSDSCERDGTAVPMGSMAAAECGGTDTGGSRKIWCEARPAGMAALPVVDGIIGWFLGSSVPSAFFTWPHTAFQLSYWGSSCPPRPSPRDVYQAIVALYPGPGQGMLGFCETSTRVCAADDITNASSLLTCSSLSSSPNRYFPQTTSRKRATTSRRGTTTRRRSSSRRKSTTKRRTTTRRR